MDLRFERWSCHLSLQNSVCLEASKPSKKEEGDTGALNLMFGGAARVQYNDRFSYPRPIRMGKDCLQSFEFYLSFTFK